MSTSYTSLLGLALPATGCLSGTWGTVVNSNITQLVECAVAGSATQSVTSADWTLTTTGSGAANQARQAILIPTGTPGVNRNIIAPAQSKTYIIVNQSNSTITVKASATTGVVIAANSNAVVAWNGSDFVRASVNAAGSSAQIQYNCSGAFGASTNFTFDGTNAYVGSGGGIKFGNTANTHYTGFKGAPCGSTNIQWQLPATDGTSGQVIATNGSGVLSFQPACGVQLAANNTWTGTQNFTGTSSKEAMKILNAAESAVITGTGIAGAVNLYVASGAVIYSTAAATSNWTVNLSFSSGTTLNTAMAVGDVISVAFLVTQGSTAYYNTSITVDSNSQSVYWQGGSAPTQGNANGIDAYTYTIIKTSSSPTYTVLGSLTQF